jgi:hypothetical protein
MNTAIHTRDIARRGCIAVAAATAFVAVAACGTEVAPPTQDIGGTQETTDAPPQPTRTSPTRGDFGDENGNPTPGQRGPGTAHDPIDRTQDWH